MQVDIKIDEKQKDPRAIIIASTVSEEVEHAVRVLSQERSSLLTGFSDGLAQIIDKSRILRAYALAQKVYVVTDQGHFTVKMRLYELEEHLDSARFVRISHSEIVNLNMVRHFDLSLTGTICVVLRDGTELYASRRYVAKIKHILGV